MTHVSFHTYIQTPNGSFLNVVCVGRSGPIRTDATSVGPNELFEVIWANDDDMYTFSLLLPDGNFLSVVGGGGVGGPNDGSCPIHSDAGASSWEEFELVAVGELFQSQFAIKSKHTNTYWSYSPASVPSMPLVLTATAGGGGEV